MQEASKAAKLNKLDRRTRAGFLLNALICFITAYDGWDTHGAWWLIGLNLALGCIQLGFLSGFTRVEALIRWGFLLAAADLFGTGLSYLPKHHSALPYLYFLAAVLNLAMAIFGRTRIRSIFRKPLSRSSYVAQNELEGEEPLKDLPSANTETRIS